MTSRRGFLAKCIGATVAMAVVPLEPLLPRAVVVKAAEWKELYKVTMWFRLNGGEPFIGEPAMLKVMEKMEREERSRPMPWQPTKFVKEVARVNGICWYRYRAES